MCRRFALRQLIPALFGALTASSAWSQPTLPPEIAQALAKAGVPTSAVAMVVAPLPLRQTVLAGFFGGFIYAVLCYAGFSTRRRRTPRC